MNRAETALFQLLLARGHYSYEQDRQDTQLGALSELLYTGNDNIHCPWTSLFPYISNDSRLMSFVKDLDSRRASIYRPPSMSCSFRGRDVADI